VNSTCPGLKIPKVKSPMFPGEIPIIPVKFRQISDDYTFTSSNLITCENSHPNIFL
jgi:hypothetical protein